MAGDTKQPQTTATAPVASSAAPSAPTSPTEVKETPKATPPASAPTRDEAATSPTTPQQKSPTPRKEKTATPPKRQGPQGPEPTSHKTEAELDAWLADFEKGEPKEDHQTESVKKATTAKTEAKAEAKAEEIDPIQKELDEANEVAAKAAGLELAPKKEESNEQDKDAPDETKDEFQAWLDTLPKGAKEKITRQQKQIRELRGQAAEQFKLTPTQSSPLAHVSNEAELAAEKRHWETVRSECQRLIRTGTQDGQGEITLADGKKHVFQTDEEIQQSLDWADRVCNAIPDWKERLNERAKSTPWEQATKLAPDLFEKGSPSHTVALDVLERVPAFKAAFPDFEVRLAHMARSMQMENEQKPSKEFPHGKAKYVRLELDAEGRVVKPAVKAAAVVKPNTKPVIEAVKDTAPSPNRPAIKQAVTGDDIKALATKYEKSRSDDDLTALLRAQERVAA